VRGQRLEVRGQRLEVRGIMVIAFKKLRPQTSLLFRPHVAINKTLAIRIYDCHCQTYFSTFSDYMVSRSCGKYGYQILWEIWIADPWKIWSAYPVGNMVSISCGKYGYQIQWEIWLW